MRIHYDHQIFSVQRAGGASKYFQRLINELVATGEHEVSTGLGPLSYWQFSGGCLCEKEKVISRIDKRIRFAANELFARVGALSAREDVYHPTLYYRTYGRKSGAMVVTHHDCTYERYPELFSNHAQIREMKARQFAQATLIICVSHSGREDLHHFYDVDESKSIVIHHGVDHVPVGESMERTQEPWGDRPYLLFVGSRWPYKQFGYVVRALGSLPALQDYSLVVAGGSAFSADENALIQESGLGDRLHKLSFVSDARMRALYSRADLLVYPSSYEGFGFPPLEALRLGTPSIVARSSSIPEVCGDAAYYFEADHFEDFRSRLEDACRNRSGRAELLERGRVIASGFTWERSARETVAVYSQAVKMFLT